MFQTLDISSSALLAQRIRMDTIAGNVANMNTTHDANNKPNPYRRRFVVMVPGQPGDSSKPGVHIEAVKLDQSPFKKVPDAGNPDADANGYVSLPNIDLTTEVVNGMDATRAYEANVMAMDATKSMFTSALRLIA
jgi:flagellar basal-body rod protein FlgC